MTEPDRWARVKDLLDQALDLPPVDRRNFIREEADGDEALEAELHALLAASGTGDDPLEHPVDFVGLTGPVESTGLEGLEIGPYRLTREIGRGGMGVVYEAERTGEVRGVVAVKVIKRGMDSDAVERRFRQERQILARLTHPNIVHFLDGGILPDGRPFFVMERVEGTPITVYCQQQGLDVEARIRLFLQVLDAVATAHRHLVVHRDLKPSNLLVRDDGTVKLLDFGVAKVLGGDDTPDATLTGFGARILTPSYSAPEQVRGEPVTTAADVYSLGVVLYELLAGRTPFQLDGAPLPEVHRVVSFEEPTRPSLVATGDDGPRTMPRHRQGRALSGDLDAVLLKALRKEPGSRYASVGEFDADLCRFLDRRPVLARQGNFAYTAERFMRRNRAAVLGSLTALVVLSASAWAIREQRFEARAQATLASQRVEDVRALLNSLVFEVHDAVAALPGSTGARMLILERAHERLDAVQDAVGNDPVLLVDLADAYRRLGEVRGRTTGASLGDLTAARSAYVEGIALAERAMELDPGHLGRLRSLALLRERLAGAFAFSGDVESAVEQAELALSMYERIADTHPDSVRHQLTVAIGVINHADFLGHPNFPNLGRPDQAREGYLRAEALLGAHPLAADSSPVVRRYRGLVAERLSRMQRLAGDLEGALASSRRSLAERMALHEDLPANDDIWRDVGVAHQNLCAAAAALGHEGEALAQCEAALELYELRHRLDSVNAQTVSDLASVHETFEELHRRGGRPADALRHLDARIRWSAAWAERDSSAIPPRVQLLDARLSRELAAGGGSGSGMGIEELLAEGALLHEGGHLSAAQAARLDSLRARGAPGA